MTTAGRSRSWAIRLWRTEGGATAVEFAFLLPLLLLAPLTAIELGRAAWAQSALNHAVQEAARCASVRPDLCATPDDIAAFAAGSVPALGVSASAFTITAEPCGTRVVVQMRHRFIAGMVLTDSPTLSAEMCRA